MYLETNLAIAVLLERDNQILVGKRSILKKHGAGMWELPSGRIEENESIAMGLRREVREELGIEILRYDIIDAYVFDRGGKNMTLLTYYCDYYRKIERSEEHSELRWVDPKQALELVPFDKQKNTIKKFYKLN